LVQPIRRVEQADACEQGVAQGRVRPALIPFHCLAFADTRLAAAGLRHTGHLLA
jgi:hypothetical protein